VVRTVIPAKERKCEKAKVRKSESGGSQNGDRKVVCLSHSAGRATRLWRGSRRGSAAVSCCSPPLHHSHHTRSLSHYLYRSLSTPSCLRYRHRIAARLSASIASYLSERRLLSSPTPTGSISFRLLPTAAYSAEYESERRVLAAIRDHVYAQLPSHITLVSPTLQSPSSPSFSRWFCSIKRDTRSCPPQWPTPSRATTASRLAPPRTPQPSPSPSQPSPAPA